MINWSIRGDVVVVAVSSSRWGSPCYGPRVISVKDTETRPRRVSGLYGTSGTIGRGVAELRGSRSRT
jgi:hypothetical protein